MSLKHCPVPSNVEGKLIEFVLFISSSDLAQPNKNIETFKSLFDNDKNKIQSNVFDSQEEAALFKDLIAGNYWNLDNLYYFYTLTHIRNTAIDNINKFVINYINKRF